MWNSTGNVKPKTATVSTLDGILFGEVRMGGGELEMALTGQQSLGSLPLSFLRGYLTEPTELSDSTRVTLAEKV